MVRDRYKTQEKILDAVGTVLAKRGFSKLGVNTIAREAGVDKVLIYRYFGGLPRLLRRFAAHGGFWPSIAELLGDKRASLTDLTEASIAILQGYLKALRKRPITQEIMRWELHERNELTDELARHREQQGLELLALIDAPSTERAAGEFNACAAIIHAGLSYLVLRAKTADIYIGVDLTSDEGWQRIHNGIAELVESYMERVKNG
jgi:AcrR family transcriptional regulator